MGAIARERTEVPSIGAWPERMSLCPLLNGFLD
jgi:hypothetical protein